MSDHSRRNALKVILASSGTVFASRLPEAWTRPVVNTVFIPAHAQATCGTFIRATSSFSENGNVCRYVIIADDNGTVLARCCCGAGENIVVQANGLSPGTYRVFGDSITSLQHTVVVETGCETRTVTVSMSFGDCNFLMATVVLPAGIISEESGQQVGPNKCGDSVNCLQGNMECPDMT